MNSRGTTPQDRLGAASSHEASDSKDEESMSREMASLEQDDPLSTTPRRSGRRHEGNSERMVDTDAEQGSDGYSGQNVVAFARWRSDRRHAKAQR